MGMILSSIQHSKRDVDDQYVHRQTNLGVRQFLPFASSQNYQHLMPPQKRQRTEEITETK